MLGGVGKDESSPKKRYKDSLTVINNEENWDKDMDDYDKDSEDSVDKEDLYTNFVRIEVLVNDEIGEMGEVVKRIHGDDVAIEDGGVPAAADVIEDLANRF
ncbi:hypothetical protein JTB14_022648 [Gonioctena quinquepunctata]|nr:hypothetical protein JTB14_022648 [Gonioctena quinquepunctata]